MKKFVFVCFLMATIPFAGYAQKKLSQEERSKLTPEQRIVYDNSFKKKSKKSKIDPIDKKVKMAKKEDRKARRIKPPKHPKQSKRSRK